jgi:hypothetical protein
MIPSRITSPPDRMPSGVTIRELHNNWSDDGGCIEFKSVEWKNARVRILTYWIVAIRTMLRAVEPHRIYSVLACPRLSR